MKKEVKIMQNEREWKNALWNAEIERRLRTRTEEETIEALLQCGFPKEEPSEKKQRIVA